MPVDFSCLPDDIIYVLGKALNEEGPVDAYTLMLLSKRTHATILPIIYSSVYLRNSRQCIHTFQYLQEYPYVASYIRTLVVAPRDSIHNSDSKSSGEIETRVAYILEGLAPNLKRMADFCWDGCCLPRSATFWQTLQRECPELSYVGTSISQRDPFSWDESTTFLQLRDLQGLSVTIKSLPDDSPQSYLSETPRFLSMFPPSFWEIIHPSRSPRLRRLSFEGDKLRSFSFSSLFALKLPSLRALTIGTFVFSDFASADFVSFLTSATLLEHLEVSPVARIPWQDINFPQIRHYGGNIYSILTGATHWSSLQSLDVSCFPLSFVRMTNFFRKTSKLLSLKSLKLRLTSEDVIVIPTGSSFYGDGDPTLDLLPALAHCYPGLEELHMISSTGSTLHWESIFLSLGYLRKLQKFSLSQTPPRFGGSTLQTAMAALSANLNVEEVTIRRSAGPWHQTADCRIDEKVVLRRISRQPPIVTVHQINYKNRESNVSSSRFLLSCST